MLAQNLVIFGTVDFLALFGAKSSWPFTKLTPQRGFLGVLRPNQANFANGLAQLVKGVFSPNELDHIFPVYRGLVAKICLLNVFAMLLTTTLFCLLSHI